MNTYRMMPTGPDGMPMDAAISLLAEEYLEADSHRRRELGPEIARMISRCSKILRAARRT